MVNNYHSPTRCYVNHLEGKAISDPLQLWPHMMHHNLTAKIYPLVQESKIQNRKIRRIELMSYSSCLYGTIRAGFEEDEYKKSYAFS